MLTFNLQSDINGNYFRGNKPSNSAGNCWSTHQSRALVLTLAQVRKLRAVLGRGTVVIDPTDTPPLTAEVFDRELYCEETNKHWCTYRDDNYDRT